jgi:hypothetical protein
MARFVGLARGARDVDAAEGALLHVAEQHALHDQFISFQSPQSA